MSSETVQSNVLDKFSQDLPGNSTMEMLKRSTSDTEDFNVFAGTPERTLRKYDEPVTPQPGRYVSPLDDKVKERYSELTPRSSQHPSFTSGDHTYTKGSFDPFQDMTLTQRSDQHENPDVDVHPQYIIEGHDNTVSIQGGTINTTVNDSEITRIISNVIPDLLGPTNKHLISAVTAKVHNVLYNYKLMSVTDITQAIADIIVATVNAERTTIMSKNYVNLNSVPQLMKEQSETLKSLVTAMSQVSKKLNVDDGLTLSKETCTGLLLTIPITDTIKLKEGNINVLWKARMITEEKIKMILTAKVGDGRLEIVKGMLAAAEKKRLEEIAGSKK